MINWQPMDTLPDAHAYVLIKWQEYDTYSNEMIGRVHIASAEVCKWEGKKYLDYYGKRMLMDDVGTRELAWADIKEVM